MPLRILLSLLGGGALALAFEPVGVFALLPLGVALLLWCVHGQRLRHGALYGGLFGAAFMLPLIVWMRAVGTDAWLALALFEALYLVLGGFALAAVSRLPAWPVWSAAVWVGIEVFRGDWPMSGFTWGRLAFATADSPVEPWFPWVGANGVSFLLALLSAALVWLVHHVRDGGRRAQAVVVLAVVVATLTLPWLHRPDWTGERTATVAVVQGNVPGDGTDVVAHHREITRSHMTATRELAEQVTRGEVPQPDFVLWPENSTAVDPFLDTDTRAGIELTSAAIGVPILVGAMVDAPDPDSVLNQGIVYDPESGAGDRYTKRHPVPFGEYIPYRDLLGNWNFGRLNQVPRDMLSGTRKEPLRIGDLEVADVICFDVAYDDTIADQVTRGADLLVVQTSNAMFIHTGQIEQQFEISRLRALETGRHVVVAAINGRSGIVAPDGDVVASIEPRTRGVVVHEVPLAEGTPLAMWVGPAIGRGSVLVGLGAVAGLLLSYRLGRTKDDQGEST